MPGSRFPALLLLAAAWTRTAAWAQEFHPPPAVHAAATADAGATIDRSPECADSRPECEAWAARGECVTNP
jgi:hypothetical protein